jgi:RimJ/RimL family protein N-acetyltransferase
MSTSGTNPGVKLQLDVQGFDAHPWQRYISGSERSGIEFHTLAELGDTEANRKRLYELNKVCSADIPGRGPFYSYEQYRDARLQPESYTPAGIILAIEGDTWVGMSAASYHKEQNFVFNEMTGVPREYRRRGIATALKVLAIRFAASLGVPVIYTFHAAANVAAIAMNRRLGYTDRL